MVNLEKSINEKIRSLPISYLNEINDFVDFLSIKYKKSSDTEYLSNLPGFSQSLKEGKLESLESCATLEDIGWE